MTNNRWANRGAERSAAGWSPLVLAAALAITVQPSSRAAQPETAERAFIEALNRGDTAELLRFADGAQGFRPGEALRVGDTPLGLATK
ncbi:MAG: hypothetical protein ICV73_25745, partial [Acetobacteraceae bacterium]|nr:hypothetical protein [Acetobacteraceae bacterium]